MKPPPTDKPLALLHVCHSCFLLRSASGTTVLIDPYFGADFRWKGHPEKHVAPPPAIAPAEISPCHGIVITHDHPDHCQPSVIREVMTRTRCGLWGPAGIYRHGVEAGIDTNLITKLEIFQKFNIGDIEVIALPNRGSEDLKPCMRMSYVFRSGGQSVFHSGDSHGPSPAWTGHADGATLALLWPSHIDKTVSFIKPKSTALMHCDRFEPGEFLCNYDAEALRRTLAARFKAVNFLAPAPGEWFWPEPLSVEELARRAGKPLRRERPPEPPGQAAAAPAAPVGPTAAPGPVEAPPPPAQPKPPPPAPAAPADAAPAPSPVSPEPPPAEPPAPQAPPPPPLPQSPPAAS